MTELASGAITAVDTVAIEPGEAVETPAIIHTSPRRIQAPALFLAYVPSECRSIWRDGALLCMVLPPIFDVFCRSPSAPTALWYGGLRRRRRGCGPRLALPVDDHQTCRHDARHDAK
jgi:hypothetical protein